MSRRGKGKKKKNRAKWIPFFEEEEKVPFLPIKCRISFVQIEVRLLVWNRP
jgi:hypothetical protein